MKVFSTVLNLLPTLLSVGLLVLAAPPFDFWPLALVGLVPLYFNIRRCSAISAGLWGWLMGFAMFMVGSRWWLPVLQDFVQLPEYAALGVMVLLAVYQAIIFGMWTAGLRLMERFSGVSPIIVGPLWFVICEAAVPFFLKSYLGITVWRAWPLTQVAEVGGPLAVSALVVLINILVAEGMLALWKRRMPAHALRWGAVVALSIIAVGGLRGWYVTHRQSGDVPLSVGLVQPNFGILSQETRRHQGFKYVRALQQANAALADKGADLIVWPESMWPYLLDRKMRRDFPDGHPWNLRGDYDGRLLVGALTHRFKSSTPRNPTVNNSAILIAKDGEFRGPYDKNHLLPFSEAMPLAERYPEAARKLRSRMPQWPDILPGQGGAVLSDGDLRVGVMICSEDLRMNYAAGIARQNPNLMVAITNDAWFGSTAAPMQHLAMAAFRAIEVRRHLVRCTNTGVSAIVDALGRVQLQGPQVDVSERPKPPTLLSGDVALSSMFALGPYTIRLFPWGCAAALIGLALMAYIRQRSEKLDEQQSLNPKRGLA